MLGSSSSTVSRGETATPTPAPTRPCTVPLLSERNTMFGARPVDASCDFDVIHRAAVVEADDRLEHDLLERRRPLCRGSGEPAGTTRTYGSRRSSTVSYGPPSDGERPEGQVELAALDHLEELALVLRLAENDLDLRVTLGEAPQQARDDLRADALERPDAQAAGIAGFERGHVRLRGEQACLDRVRVAEEDLPGLGQRDRARPAGPLDEAQADDALERRDLL